MEECRTPSWGAWIEIRLPYGMQSRTLCRTPSWGAWIEIVYCGAFTLRWRRTPSWGAWIEIDNV